MVLHRSDRFSHLRTRRWDRTGPTPRFGMSHSIPTDSATGNASCVRKNWSNELVEAADDKQLQIHRPLLPRRPALPRRTRQHGTRPPVHRTAVPGLAEREERSAVAIAGTEVFSGRTKTFIDPRLCESVVDRLTFAGQIIGTGTPANAWPMPEPAASV